MTCQDRHRGDVKVELHPICNLTLEKGEWSAPTCRRFSYVKDPVPIVQEAARPQGMENLAPTRIQSPECPVHSESLYRPC